MDAPVSVGEHWKAYLSHKIEELILLHQVPSTLRISIDIQASGPHVFIRISVAGRTFNIIPHTESAVNLLLARIERVMKAHAWVSA